MLIPKTFSFCNIGRFIEPQTIDFSSLGSLTQMDAEIKGTGRSSGAGKTTVFHAFEYCLGLNDLPNGVLQSRLTKEGMWTKVVCDWDGTEVIIERGKSTFCVSTPSEVIKGNSKITEAKLDEMYGMPRNLMRQILHKRQGEGGFFLDMGPSDTGKFLTSCLGLQKEQDKLPLLDLRLAPAIEKEKALKATMDSNHAGLEATKNAMLSLGNAPTLDFDSVEKEKELNSKLKEAQDLTKTVKDYNDKEMSAHEATRPEISVVPFDRTNIVSIENDLSILNNSITELNKAEEKRKSTISAQISECTLSINSLNAAEQQRQAEVKRKIDALVIESSGLEYAEQSRQSQVKNSISAKQVAIIQAQTSILNGDKALEAAKSLGKELEKVRSSICPTCEQGWITETAKNKELQILQQLGEHKKSIIAGNAAKALLQVLDSEIAQLKLDSQPKPIVGLEEINAKIAQYRIDSQPQINPEIQTLTDKIAQYRIDLAPKLNLELLDIEQRIYEKKEGLKSLRQDEQNHQVSENAKNQGILKKFNEHFNCLTTRHMETLIFAQEKEEVIEKELSELSYKIKSYDEAKSRHDSSIDKLNNQSYEYAQKILTTSLELAQVQEDIELANESKKAIKSYLSCCFEDALESIGNDATALIRAIPNMATATVQFDGLKETKEGKIKEEVTCSVSMDGEIGVPIKSLSGGEKSSTDLAIDLSVIKFIEEKTGKGISIMILDEPFTGLDTACIEQAIEMLKNSSLDKKLLIVDHNPTASQSIENRITVVRDGLTSTISQQ